MHLFGNKTVAFDITTESTYKWRNTEAFVMQMQTFSFPEVILTWDLLTRTYPNNRAVCGYLCNSRWNQRKSSQASGCMPRALWMDYTLQSHIHFNPAVYMEMLTNCNMTPTHWSTSFNLSVLVCNLIIWMFLVRFILFNSLNSMGGSAQFKLRKWPVIEKYKWTVKCFPVHNMALTTL